MVTSTGLGLLIMLIVSDQTNPLTLYGHRCYGLFRTCDRLMCVEAVEGELVTEVRLDSTDSAHELNRRIEPFVQADWKQCTLDSAEKIYGATCIYDRELWFQSDKQLGFDFCNGEVAKSDPDPAWQGDEFVGAQFNREHQRAPLLRLLSRLPFSGRRILRHGRYFRGMAKFIDL